MPTVKHLVPFQRKVRLLSFFYHLIRFHLFITKFSLNCIQFSFTVFWFVCWSVYMSTDTFLFLLNVSPSRFSSICYYFSLSLIFRPVWCFDMFFFSLSYFLIFFKFFVQFCFRSCSKVFCSLHSIYVLPTNFQTFLYLILITSTSIKLSRPCKSIFQASALAHRFLWTTQTFCAFMLGNTEKTLNDNLISYIKKM